MDLFILGAGASAPYGFPVASELRQHLCQARWEDLATAAPVASLNPQDYLDFARVFALSNTPSIDLFLTRNPQYSLMGKLATGVLIAQAEQRANELALKVNDDWYSVLFSRLTEGRTHRSQVSDVFASLQFVSFNYDRSLEHFFETSLYYSFFHSRRTFDTPSNVELPQPRIDHLYGSLGPLDEVPYGSLGESGTHLLTHLKTSYDERTLKGDLQSRFEQADRLFFLGFGYGSENLRNLPLDQVDLSAKEVYGTVVGFEPAEVERVRTRFATARQVVLEPVSCSLLLRRWF